MRCFFFFQAEDGIRDLVRSRGLGDVYKRQLEDPSLVPDILVHCAVVACRSSLADVTDSYNDETVSYTHLTLPTSDLV